MDWDGVDLAGARPHTPDIMNDPAFETNHGNRTGGADEMDTCRICRGEGTEEEQLFYPCKCSGSIKFVHQNCLMEWLSHSQKKHCELCKTPFRFTKLYDPNMPSELPVPVFLKELFLHACRALLTWLRFGLVAFVWLGLLPWSMRTIWRGLFWLADGRWPVPDTIQRPASAVANRSVAWLAAHGTSPARPTLAWDVPGMSMATASPLVGNPQPQSAPSMLNFSTGEPLIYSIAKTFLSNAFSAPTPSGANNSASATTIRRIRQPSWLSDMAFLNNATSSPALNNIIIDTLEGQLITLLVVISFILVFLIREWVVQQQPVINLPEGEGEVLGQLLNRAMEQHAAAEEVHEQEAEEEAVAENEAPGPEHQLEESDHEPENEVGDAPTQRRGVFNENPLPDTQTFNPFAPNYVGPYPENSPYVHNARGQDPPIFRGNFHNHNRPFQIPADASNRPSMWDEPETNFTYQSAGARHDFTEFGQNEGREDQDEKPDQGPSTTREPMAARENIPPFNPFSGQTTQWRFPDFDEGHTSPAEESSYQPSRTTPAAYENHTHVPHYENDGSDAGGAVVDSHIPDAQSTGSQSGNDDNDDTPPGTAANARNTEDALGDDEALERDTNAESHPDSPTQPAYPREELLYTPIIPPRNIFDRMFNFFWGAIPIVLPNEEDEEGGADPQPALIRQHQRHRRGGGDANEAANRGRAAAPANDALDGNDAEAVEDVDDLEGVMELIGMHGPLFGLLQNAVFSALLISFTVSIGIWLPYLWGKIALVMLVNPVGLFIRVPITAISMLADITVDLILGCFAYVVYLMNVLVRAILAQLGLFLPSLGKLSAANSITFASLSLMEGSSQRLTGLITTMFTFHETDLPMFSAVSHEALKLHQARFAYLGHMLFNGGKALLHDIPLSIIQSEKPLLAVKSFLLADLPKAPGLALTLLKSLGEVFGIVNGLTDWSTSDTLIQNSTTSASYELSRWSSKDRLIAIILGYCFASLLGIAYLRISGIISGTRRDGQIGDGPLAEILRQAGGVMKVIVIIGIEMIVFPLYCGILLDIALLPLFGNGLFASRAAFTLESPLTSLFVHWFIGTCYMFHFALFVSMCRKIMRSGVLYFIRDPDDPTFHPVRDVLERNITTQLRKIAFSALVYGALVIICLGGVVWGLSLTFSGILPVYWSSNEPVLEFPVDLLFYNFVMPVAIRAIKPSDGLHKIYDWWFHECARMLRLTHFLFGDRKPDEEGYFEYPTWREAFLSLFTREKPRPRRFLRNGRFVRAPASDQVRIPKGEQVFVEVNENNERIDGNPDNDDGRHGKKNEMYSPVYVPPNFRARIFAFLLLLWVFAAATGVGITIIPLIIGRRMLSFMFPPHIRVNDIYALSAGVYAFGTVYYGYLHFHKITDALHEGAEPYMRSPKQLLYKTCNLAVRALRVVYLAAVVGLFLPSAFALITEFYLLIPLHTYLSPSETHIIYFVQDWTLGILYVRMAIRFLLRKPLSLSAMALRGIVRDGWTNPDIWLATRVFFIPAALVVLIATVCPLPIGFILNSTLFSESSATFHSQVYRYSYPAFLVLMLFVRGVHVLQRQIGVWRVSIRDDVYMIGERLHNLGEKRARNVGQARRMITS
ncbi:putative RING-type E3 ubiquitin transferase [Microsporum canis]|uniref:RING-type E3 ubiquitin transferase n=1 Tax=Arthroderma otae (strain ATCC MYA-4605 / CBS 113480) TaxID=554155 RepID=C5FPQ4_ARTOC|nr:RING finger membrane protein [Microsporum canis CBS 113480]EEQ31659.1 RING finger membrane protein [Microsporum canis CBS 113480]